MKSNGRSLILGLISKTFVVLLLVSATNVSAFGDNLGDHPPFYVESQNLINEYEQTAPIPLEWESECIGVVTSPTYGIPTAISYVYICTLHVDDFSGNDTNIKGTVEFRFYEPGKGCGSPHMRCVLTPEFIGKYMCRAKAAFTGTLNNSKIEMEIKGDLISGCYPLGFSPGRFGGFLNGDLTQILWNAGEVMQVYFKSKYEMPKDEYYDSEFIVGKEKGAFGNNCNFNNTIDDFFPANYPEKWKSYMIVYFFDKLINLAKEKEINLLSKVMHDKPWGGACHGMALTMGLVYNTPLSISDISKETVDCYFRLEEKPKNNSYLRDAIHYYYLSQYLDQFNEDLMEYGTIDSSKNKWNFPFKKIVSLNKFLKELVEDTRNSTKNNKVLMMNYGYYDAMNLIDRHGHAILVTTFKYRSKEKIYELGLYDMNGFKETLMTISGDFDWFNFVDGNGNQITENRYTDICYFKPEKFNKLTLKANSNVVSFNYSYVVFSKDSSFKLTSDTGLSLMYGNNEFSGDLPLFSLDYIDNDIKIKTAYCSSYKIEPISRDIDINIYDNDYFKAIEGSNIESIDVSIPGDIKLNGKAYTFKAYASVEEMLDEKESGMGSIFAKGKGEVVVHPGQNTVEATSKKPMSGIKTEVYQGVNVIEGTIKGNQKKVVLRVAGDADDHNLEESGMIIFAKSGYAYKGRPIKPFVSVYVSGKSLKKNKEFKVQYENNVEVGTGTLIVTGVGEYSGSLTAEFPIIPKKVKVKKVTSCQSGFEVTWKASGPKDGFEIQYATDLDFKNVETMKIEDSESSSAQVEGLEVGGEYFVRIRAYKTEAETGKTYNSNWSDVKSVLIYPY